MLPFFRAQEIQKIRRQGPPAVEAYRSARFRRLVSYAARHSPFYRDLYDGIDLASCHLSDLPLTNKGVLMDNFDEAVTDTRLNLPAVMDWVAEPISPGRRFLGEFLLLRSSGTTGRNGYFAYSEKEFKEFTAHALCGPNRKIRGIVKFGGSLLPGRKIKIAAVIADRGAGGQISMARKRGLLPKYFSHLETIDVSEPIQRIVDRLNEYNPRCLIGYPTTIEALAAQQQAGTLNTNVTEIMVFGETLTAASRCTIEKAFTCHVRNSYGAAENFCIGATCEQNKMHVFSELVLLEPVDGKGRSVPAGELSEKVLLTSLEKYVQPIIRYELEDSIILCTEQCACGHPTPVIEITGRTAETFRVQNRNGECVSLNQHALFGQIVDLLGVAKFQIRLEARDRIRVLFVPLSTDCLETLRRHIRENFSGLIARLGLEGSVSVEVVAVENIDREPGGKYRKLVNLVDT